MKPTKVAAVVAGSVMALGAAAPAMAAGPAAAPAGLNNALGALTSSQPLKTDALSSTTDGSALKTVTDTADTVNETTQSAPLLGGLPLPK
ncbi:MULTISPECIES: hypothetical protein [Streptomyces]|uniref:Secreted protein n=1 Tax=Streptomyces solicathayae TaxID=3081768 RepID=A0ABZ0LSI0_9ACTN|nr:hypothetical protein [Streptomyces sp. HUAS YS2]WOX22397.1 hypothetical protein R2D22_13710 [Streptomyces sp. HUAS YS2]